jgi:Collagen triple helix repeat (20 copies)
MRRSHLLAAAAGALAATALAGGVAWATIPGSNGTIQGCYLKVAGILRVIDPAKGQSCSSTAEVPISWNQQGQSGPPGAPGATGPAGSTGLTGPAGQQGLQGLAGTNGTNGQDGQAGAPGNDGINGADGKDGLPGTDGTDGANGISVSSQPEPAGANCPAGGSKFTAVTGVTYTCNGIDGSGSSGPVLDDHSGGASMGDLGSAAIVLTSQVTAGVVCVNRTLLFTLSENGSYATTASLVDGAILSYRPAPSSNGGAAKLLANTTSPQRFSVSMLTPAGFSFEMHGFATADATGCSIVYHATLSHT